jgi:3-oxoadipate enol-lactonase
MKKYILMLLVLLLSLTACQNRKEETKENSMSASVKTISVENMEMDYIVFGEGDKSFIILPGLSIHSVMGSAELIAEAYKEFTDEYTVYVFDRAKNIKEGYTIKDMADDTAKAMKTLNIENADIFGASQGGMIGLYLAIDYPELVHKMILGSTAARTNDKFNVVVDEWINLSSQKEETKLLESFVDNVYSEATLKEYRDILISSNANISDEEYERFIILASACKDYDCYDELSNIKCPVLVLGSKGDQVVGVDGSIEIADKLNCEIYLYDENYGHGVYDEATDYKDRCLEFFNK